MNIIYLSNNKKVDNFSSPHSFTFVDGSELPAVSDIESERLKVTFNEVIAYNGDVELSFELSNDIMVEIDKWMNLYYNGLVDIVFCCLPMITALRESGYDLKKSPFRAVRIEDRIKKLVSIDKQCV